MVGLSSVEDYFLSHAGADKDFVKEVATRIRFAGRDCFLDAWSIGVGESIPGAIAETIRSYSALVLFWSTAAEASAWVRREFQVGLTRCVEDEDRALVVVRLDDADVPELVRDLKWIDGCDEDPDRVANELLGLSSGDRLKAMQRYLDSM